MSGLVVFSQLCLIEGPPWVDPTIHTMGVAVVVLQVKVKGKSRRKDLPMRRRRHHTIQVPNLPDDVRGYPVGYQFPNGFAVEGRSDGRQLLPYVMVTKMQAPHY